MKTIAQIIIFLTIFGSGFTNNLLDPQFKEPEDQENPGNIYWILAGIFICFLLVALKVYQWAKGTKRVPFRYPIQGPYINLEMPVL